MSIQVNYAQGERCDACDENTGEVVIILKNRSKEQGMVQLWIHPTCFVALHNRVTKLLAKDGVNK